MNIQTHTFKVYPTVKSMLIAKSKVEQQKTQDFQTKHRSIFQCEFYLNSNETNNQQLGCLSFFQSLPRNLNYKVVNYDAQARSLTVRSYFIDYILQQIVEIIQQQQPINQKLRY